MDYQGLNDKLVAEGNLILEEIGLRSHLERFGDVQITGSHELGTMAWRDLDIYLITEDMSPSMFLELGKGLVELLNPRRMTYRNEFIGLTEGLPTGYYWGIYSKLDFEEEWKIDIWALNAETAESHVKTLKYLKKELTAERKKAALEIKNHYCKTPEYRKSVTSMDIYEAVINGVDSVQSFRDRITNQDKKS